jgi:hypothetical protein
MKSGERRNGSRTYLYLEALSPLLTAFLIMVCYTVFNAVFGHCEWGDLAGCKSLCIRDFMSDIITGHVGDNVEALPGRALWAFIAALNYLACLATIFVAFYLLRASSEGDAHPARRALIFLCSFIILSAAAGMYAMPSESIYPPPVLQALEVTAKADVSNIVHIVRWTIGVSYAAAALVALTSCIILMPLLRGSHRALELARRMRLLRTLLYFGTVLLVVVSLRFSAELLWSVDLLRAWRTSTSPEVDAHIKTVENLFSALNATAAGLNTLLLASVYLPAALVLRRRAHVLAKQKLGADATLPARDEWLKKQGLLLSFSEQLPRFAAILAPLLAGPVGDLIGRLTK